jgi:hypothetical protein
MLLISALVFLPVLDGYLLDRLGLTIESTHLLPLLAGQVAIGLPVFGRQVRWTDGRERARLVGAIIAFAVVGGLGMFVAWPSYLPASSSPNAINEYVAIDFVSRFHRLAADAPSAGQLGQLLGYPLGAGIFATVFSQAGGIPPVLLLQPMAALFLALAATFGCAVVTEAIGGPTWVRVGAVAFGVASFFWPVAYTVGQFTRDFHLSEMLGIACVMAIWFWSIACARTHTALALTTIVGFELALILIYPALLPLGILASIGTLHLGDDRPSWRRRLTFDVLIAAPLAPFVVTAIQDHGGSLFTVFHLDSSTISPSLETLPTGLLVFALGGLVYATTHRHLRAATVLTWLTLFLTVSLYFASPVLGEVARQACRAMVFVLAPQLGVLVSIAALTALTRLSADVRENARLIAGTSSAVAFIGLLLFVRGAWLDEFGRYDPRPTVEPLTWNQIAVASWIGANLPSQKVLFFTNTPATADWIENGLLKRQGAFGSGAIAPATVADYLAWFDSPSAPTYGVVTERFGEITDIQADILYQSGDAGVIIRRNDEPNFDPSTDRVLPRGTWVTSNLAMLRVVIDNHRHAPGDTLSEAVILQATNTFSGEYIVEARLRDPSGQVLSRQAVPVTTLDLFKPIRVDRGQMLQLHVPVAIPATIPLGLYDVELVFFDDKWGTLPVHLGNGAIQTSIVVGPIVIASSSALPAPGYQPPIPIGGNLGNQLELVGITQPVIAGGAISFDAYWRALAKMAESYTFFVQVLDPQGKPVGQVDTIPWSGGYPTGAWDPGQIVRDQYRVTLPANLPPGEYHIIAGAYLLRTMQRLPVVNPNGSSGSDYLGLQTIELPGP